MWRVEVKSGALLCVFVVATLTSLAGTRKVQYEGSPNHREIALRALELARAAAFNDTSVSIGEIQARIEAGVYSEDFEPFSAIVGAHYPAPWSQGPEFAFGGYYRVSKIPYGSLADDSRSSGWFRGLPHGYDPAQGFRWPGATGTTIEWANAATNTFTWNNALLLYRSGRHAEAYECLGHLLHLLMDLSIPAHVRVVDHGMHLSSKRSGAVYDPDIAVLLVDEYEMALSGGIELSGVATLIPDVLADFRAAVQAADVSKIPRFSGWTDYFTSLALFTYQYPAVNQYYVPPAAAGLFGQCRDQGGNVVLPSQYGIAPPAPINGRWTQVGVFSTASLTSGSILPVQAMKAMCADLVPKSAEYCAGLLLRFVDVANTPTSIAPIGSRPVEYRLEQNYPNPCNPLTVVGYQLPVVSDVQLVVYDMLGREVSVLVNGRIDAGVHEVTFDAAGLPSAVYFYTLRARPFADEQAGGAAITRKLLLMR
jgi:hypothetical protein